MFASQHSLRTNTCSASRLAALGCPAVKTRDQVMIDTAVALVLASVVVYCMFVLYGTWKN